jgi:membrane protein YqaA with SNARE-associated domain
MQQIIFIADLIARSTCFGHHYAHHQELQSIIQKVAACGIWCFGFQVSGVGFRVVCPVCGLLQMPIISSSRILYRCLLPVVFGVLILKLSV